MNKVLLALLSIFMALPVMAGVDVQLQADIWNLDGDNIRFRSNMAMTSDGYVWIFYNPQTNYGRTDAVVFAAWAATYTDTPSVVTYFPGREPRYDVHSFGDTIAASFDASARTEYPPLYGWFNDFTYTVDTVIHQDSIGTTWGRPGTGMVGPRPLSLHAINVVTDTTTLYSTTAIPVAGNFGTRVVSSGDLLGDGWRTPLYYNGVPWGILAFEAGAASDLRVMDTLAFTVVNTDFFPAIGMFASHQFVMLDDSNGVAIFQEDDVAGQDSVIAFTFKIRGTGSGTPTFVAGADSTMLLSQANVPDGFNSCPSIQHLVGTDSLFAYYLYWDDTANYDSADIAYKVSADKGATWGTQQISRAATNGINTYNLMTHETNYRDGSGNLITYLLTTRNVTTDDSAWVYIDTLEVAAVATRQRVTIIQ